MVKVINIDTKTRTIHVSNTDGDIKTWRTTESGAHFPIRKGESTKEALDKFVESKRGGDSEKKLRSLWDKKEKAATDVVSAKQQGGDVSRAKARYQKAEKDFVAAKERLAERHTEPSKEADVSDIVKSYKEKMAAVGPRASIKKTDRIEADAIKEFMTRKLGANRPYDDYYNYWLSGMDKATKDAFNEIYNESEAREMAFSELASDVDHSGLAVGDPTYDELMQIVEKRKAEREQRKKERESMTPNQRKKVDLMAAFKSGKISEDEFMEAAEKIFAAEAGKNAKTQQQPAKKESERDWQRGDDEDEDAYFARRDKTKAEAKNIDNVHEWYKKVYKGDDAGTPKNKNITFQQMSDDLLSGKMTDFYESVGVGESDVREKLFTELTERTGRPYDDFYLSWLYGGLENAQKEARGTKFRKDPKLGWTTGRPTKK